MSLFKLNLLAGGLAKADVNVLFNQYLQSEANFEIKCCSGGKTTMLANENTGLLLFGFVGFVWSLLGSSVPNTDLVPHLSHANSRFLQGRREVSTAVTTRHCLPCQRRAHYQQQLQQWWAAPWNSISNMQTHTFCSWKSLTSSKTTELGNLNYFLVAWNSTIPTFGQGSIIIWVNKDYKCLPP